MSDNLLHGLVEFLMVDLMVIISVHLFNNGFPKHLIFFIATMEHIS